MSASVTKSRRPLLANGFLVFVTAWPMLQFAAVKVYDYDPWYGAGWAMYLAPSRAADVHIVQRDGTMLPESVAASPIVERITQRASVQRRFYDPLPDMVRALEREPAGVVDGLYVRTTLRRFNGWTGERSAPVVLHDVEAQAPTARDVANTPYASVQRSSPGSWRREDGSAEIVVGAPGESTSVVVGQVERVAAEQCAEYPGCLSLGDGMYIPFYAEGTAGWVADCGGRDATIQYRDRIDAELAEEGIVVVWRSIATTCVVPPGAPRWVLGSPSAD